MTSGLTGWIASGREHRLALLIAVAGSLVLVLLLVKPSWFLTGQTVSDSKTHQSKTTAYSLPPKPERGSPTDKGTNQAPALHKTGKQPNPQAKKIASPEKILDHKPAMAVTQPLKDKNRLVHGYYVQVGAFKDVARAKKLANSLQHAGWHVQVIFKDHALHAVLVGPWPTRNQAQSTKLQLAYKNKVKGFIIQQ